MRKEERKILFETLKFQGAEEVLFSTRKITDQSALIETVIDAMEKFKNLHIHAVSGRSELLSCDTCVFNTHSWSEDYPCATCCNFDKHKAT